MLFLSMRTVIAVVHHSAAVDSSYNHRTAVSEVLGVFLYGTSLARTVVRGVVLCVTAVVSDCS